MVRVYSTYRYRGLRLSTLAAKRPAAVCTGQKISSVRCLVLGSVTTFNLFNATFFFNMKNSVEA